MIEVAPNLFVGDQNDYEAIRLENGWQVVHCAKDPWHRQALGYSGRGAPKDHPEYLYARRGARLALNLIDAEDPAYIPKEIIDVAVQFIKARATGKLLTHCNQGASRSPTIAMLAIAPSLSADFLTAEETFSSELYPPYMPKSGMRGFAEAHWAEYHGG